MKDGAKDLGIYSNRNGAFRGTGYNVCAPCVSRNMFAFAVKQCVDRDTAGLFRRLVLVVVVVAAVAVLRLVLMMVVVVAVPQDLLALPRTRRSCLRISSGILWLSLVRAVPRPATLASAQCTQLMAIPTK